MVDQRAADSAGVIKGAETIDLQEGGSHGVLLLHGFGDTPQTLTLLARRLAKSSYGVFVPLLPGHGRTMQAFRRSRSEEWIEAARESLYLMRARYATVSIVGLSMGGALGAIIASGTSPIESLVLIAPYLGMPMPLRIAARTHWIWGGLAGEINARDPRSVHDPIEREKNLAYGAVTGRTLYELSKVVRKARKALPTVTAPTLIILSKEDPRVATAIADFAMKELGARDKKLVLTEGAGHIITVDYGRERVFSEVEKWVRTHNGSTTAAGDISAAVERR
ncbi:MAG TPA: alpha/beta fold hydrolase [Gemmatimonadaceae bacterium]|nr:alpha/beta fold hydrolase [Gemmatimonadaceae bacterium]